MQLRSNVGASPIVSAQTPSVATTWTQKPRRSGIAKCSTCFGVFKVGRETAVDREAGSASILLPALLSTPLSARPSILLATALAAPLCTTCTVHPSLRNSCWANSALPLLCAAAWTSYLSWAVKRVPGLLISTPPHTHKKPKLKLLPVSGSQTCSCTSPSVPSPSIGPGQGQGTVKSPGFANNSVIEACALWVREQT